MSGELPLVSYVIPTHNGGDSIAATLESIQRQEYPQKEIVVVDDQSTDGTCSVVENVSPEALLISLPQNRGHTGASNVGFETANGKYIAMVDDDVELVEPTWTRQLVEILEADDQICIAQPKLVAGSLEDPIMEMYTEEQDLNQFHENGTLARRDALQEQGYYDERFFMGYNGFDLSIDLRNAGKKIVAYPEVTTLHKDDPRKMSGIREFYEIRNRFWVLWRVYPAQDAAIETSLSLYRNAQKVRSRETEFEIFLKACIAAFRQFPRYAWKRRTPRDDFYDQEVSLSRRWTATAVLKRLTTFLSR